MTGRLKIEPRDAPAVKHTHLMAPFAASRLELRFSDPRRFGGIFWIGRDDRSDLKLGPEPLRIKPAQLAARLAKTKRAIKSALLDQSVLAGLGNIYVDESLFHAHIHPLSRSDRLSQEQVRALNRAIKTTLRRAIRHRGSSVRDYVDANGARGGFQKLHRVYDRAGDACAVCGIPIQRIVLGGRSTHFCPHCQRRAKTRG
jgi:formamidopyrimidine-DNA glycosylase